MDDNNIKAEDDSQSRLTPEMAGMLGLVKKSTIENKPDKESANNNVESSNNNGVKVPENKATNGNKPISDGDNDVKVINENTDKQEPSNEVEKKEEKIEIKLKPEEFVLNDEEVGFPSYLKGWVTRGRTIPINRKTWTEIDIEACDAILECPSQVVPLFIKKPHLFPVKEVKKVVEEVKKEETNGDKIKEEKKVEEDKKENDKKENDKKEDDKKEDDKSESTENKDEKTNETNKESDDKNEKQQQQNDQLNKLTMLSIDDYYKSSVGSFLMGIGLRRCQETYLKESVKQTQKLIKKEGELAEHVEALKAQQEQFEDCKAVNSIYTYKQEKCEMCDFKTDSDAVMDYHMSIPHISNRKEYKCNFCTFLTRDSRVIAYHFLNDHKKHCNIQLPLNLYNCPTCNYESNQKAKAATHMAKCSQVFQEDKVQQSVDNEQEYPTITSKLITKEDLDLYDSTIQALKPVVMNPGMQMPCIPGLPRGLQQQILIMQQQQFARQKLIKPKPTANNQRANVVIRPNNLLNNQNTINTLASGLNGNLVSNINFAKAPQLYHMLQTGTVNNNQLLTNLQQARQNVVSTTAVKLPQQLNNRSIAPMNSAAMGPKNLNNLKTGIMTKNVKDVNGNKQDTFVICEICDGYIKDLEQLRTHMSWVHKVKIHPKMIASRPPLNCQKCQWRFFTDQGLERHLLGAHGLVTSNMQDLVDQGQDAGRCTICGKSFASKLVDHMNKIHKTTLRPAHLSYKCTVCSATFNLYRLFESHVYMVHSSSKRLGTDDQPLNQANKKSRTLTTIEIGKSVNGNS